MRKTSRIVAAAVLAVGLAAAAPARAFRVFLDHDQDDDLATFDNLVEGLASAPITVTVVLGPEDENLDYLPFSVSWDCHHVLFEGIPHGDIDWPASLPVSPPFTDPMMTACTGLGCGCLASRFFDSPVGTPRTPGSYRFAVLGFSRDPSYDSVRFQVECSQCSYLPGDEGATAMTFTTLIAADPTTWGRAKASYR